MTVLNRYRVEWSGGPGGAGVSTFYGLPEDTTALADLRTFFDSIKGVFPPAISWAFPNAGDQIESTTGVLTGGWSSSPAANVTGNSPTAGFAAGVGAMVSWETGFIHNGRRLRGRTFLTSLSMDRYDSSGTLDNGSRTTLQTAVTTLAAQGWMKVWSRPKSGSSAYGAVSSGVVPDRVSWLRTRRV